MIKTLLLIAIITLTLVFIDKALYLLFKGGFVIFSLLFLIGLGLWSVYKFLILSPIRRVRKRMKGGM